MPSTTLSDLLDSTHEHARIGTKTLARVSVEVGAATHPGKVRSNNEDQYLVADLAKSMKVVMSSLPDNGSRLMSDELGHLFVVADGMGGAAAGETASSVAIESVETYVLNAFKWFLHQGGREEEVLSRDLSEAIKQADRAVVERARSDPRLHGMGTTLTMAYSIGTELFVAHAGDTRAYLFREGSLQQITKDHTLVQLLVDTGALTPEQAEHDRRRHVVTNAIGGPSEGVHSEMHKLTIANGDTLLLCSDGLFDVVSHEDIAMILSNAKRPSDACQRLIDRTLSLGAPDNVTIIYARFTVP
jgi:protein phosphatase